MGSSMDPTKGSVVSPSGGLLVGIVIIRRSGMWRRSTRCSHGGERSYLTSTPHLRDTACR
jgi:hypothetical protein